MNENEFKNILEDIFCTPLGVLFERDRQRIAEEKRKKEEE